MAPVPMRPTTIRFAQDAEDLIRRAAETLDISVAQFVRESAIMRAMFVSGEIRDDLQLLSEAISRLARKYDD